MSHVRSERSINWHMGWSDQTGPFPTRMVETINNAPQKPITELDAIEIRLLISQDVAQAEPTPGGGRQKKKAKGTRP